MQGAWAYVFEEEGKKNFGKEEPGLHIALYLGKVHGYAEMLLFWKVVPKWTGAELCVNTHCVLRIAAVSLA